MILLAAELRGIYSKSFNWYITKQSFGELNPKRLTGAKSVKPNASKIIKAQEAKIAKEQIKAEKAIALAKEQKAALKAKLARWKEGSVAFIAKCRNIGYKEPKNKQYAICNITKTFEVF